MYIDRGAHSFPANPFKSHPQLVVDKLQEQSLSLWAGSKGMIPFSTAGISAWYRALLVKLWKDIHVMIRNSSCREDLFKVVCSNYCSAEFYKVLVTQC